MILLSFLEIYYIVRKYDNIFYFQIFKDGINHANTPIWKLDEGINNLYDIKLSFLELFSIR